jgi:hypothetical protein
MDHCRIEIINAALPKPVSRRNLLAQQFPFSPQRSEIFYFILSELKATGCGDNRNSVLPRTVSGMWAVLAGHFTEIRCECTATAFQETARHRYIYFKVDRLWPSAETNDARKRKSLLWLHSGSDSDSCTYRIFRYLPRLQKNYGVKVRGS